MTHQCKELFIDPGPGDPSEVEWICERATNRPMRDVAAVSVASTNVAQAANLLFGTGIGVVASIDGTGPELVDQARRSVANGATEIALSQFHLDQTAVMRRLKSRLGVCTPITINLPTAGNGVDLAAAEQALRMGADFVSYSPSGQGAAPNHDVTALLALAHDLQLGGVKITVPAGGQGASLVPDQTPVAPRLRMPTSVDRR